MVSSAAPTVPAYLKELPAERRAVVSKVRALVRRHLPPGYRESMGYGMIGYSIPLARYPDTHNGQPLGYVGLAAQKNNYALYLMGCYMDRKSEALLREAFRKAGKKPDMGKCCLRFRSLDDLPLDTIGALVASMPVEAFVALYEKNRPKKNAKKK
jgi:hypothetical protein